MIHKFKPLACGHHSHGHASLDAGSTAEGRIRYAASIDRVADCLTDHGVMSGLAEHWMFAEQTKKLAKDGKIAKSIQSIQGIELYIIDPDRPPKVQKNGVVIPQYYHLTVHFKTTEAYFYFCKMSKIMEDRAIVKYGERKPLMTFQELEGICGHIMISSGCLLSPIQSNVLRGRFDLAVKYYEYLSGIAGKNNWMVEVFPHQITHNWHRPYYDKTSGIQIPGEFKPILSPRDWEGTDPAPEADSCTGCLDIQKRPNQFVIEMAAKYRDKCVISLDDHYGMPADKVVSEAKMGNGEERWKFFGSYHSYTSEEAAIPLIQQLDVSNAVLDEWIDNSYHFVEQFQNYKFPTKDMQVLLPKSDMIYGIEYTSKRTDVDIFWEKANEYGMMPPKDHPRYQEYIDRVNFELDVITNNDAGINFLPYMFILEDMCKYARANDILYTSRGSAGGCLVLYLLKVVITDPIHHDLSFERFLNPGRIKGGSWTDVDLDWEDRDLIIAYAVEKYGDKVCRIATDTKLGLKVSIQDAERAANGVVSKETAALTKSIHIPMGVNNDSEWLFGSKKYPEPFFESDSPVAEALRKYSLKNPDIWETVKRCIGVNKSRGIHPGGIIITPVPVHHCMPVVKTANGEHYATAYDMNGVEYTGGVKYDMLGIKTLTAMGVTMRSIKRHTGKQLVWGEFPEDEAVFEGIIKKGRVGGLFQLDTNITASYMKKIPPRNVKEASALTALLRPGCLDAAAPDPSFNGSAAEYYVECVLGHRKPYFIHEDLRPILEPTLGVSIYQESLMKIGAQFAGYSPGDADTIIRKGVGKKIPEKLKQFADDLGAKLPARGWNEVQINSLMDLVIAASNYGFNAAHSVSYGIVFWNGAWLKHYYEPHFWVGMLTAFMDKSDKLRSLMNECGWRIRPCDAIKSHPTEWLVEDKEYVRMPLSLIKGCGAKTTTPLRNFIDTPLEELEIGEEATDEME